MFFSAVFLLGFSLSTCDLSGIVPEIVPHVPEELKVLYPDRAVASGDKVDIELTKNAPLLIYTASSDHFYALVMIDPDAPDPRRPVFGPFLHWLVVNVAGNRLESGKVLAPYMQPSPPAYSPAHRYVFLVFRQKAHLDSPSYMEGRHRSRIDLAQLQRELATDGLAAASFFYAAHR